MCTYAFMHSQAQTKRHFLDFCGVSEDRNVFPNILVSQGKPQIDDVVWEGPGASLPDRCWDRQGVILRTLDIVAYKVRIVYASRVQQKLSCYKFIRPCQILF